MADADEVLRARLPAASAGQRLDRALAALYPEHSRSRLQAWIDQQRVRVDGAPARRRQRVRGGEEVEIRPPPPAASPWSPEALPLALVHEDAALLVVYKPAGLVVHPGAGNPRGTLVNALLHHAPELAALPRCGIVHRLDKDTSGLLVVARTESVRRHLVAQLKARSVTREYLAVVRGLPVAGGVVEAPIGRHRVDRKRMAVTERGRPALTRYRVEARYRAHALLRLSLATGRTHQIRVHMAHAGHPLVGDPLYGGRAALPPGASEALVAVLRGFRRQALHAETLALEHPEDGRRLSWRRPPPEDFQALVAALAADAGGA